WFEVNSVDSSCQNAAISNNLPGTYLAWLSDADTWPAMRFTQSQLPWINVTGSKVADDWADLTNGSIDGPIKTVHGQDHTTYDFSCTTAPVRTGTKTDGTPGNPSHMCENWTTTHGASSFGSANKTNGAWTSD